MKVESLTLQALGPFNERQHIDFQALGENALYLINGPTGAGKTTLLDALCFALYGQTTGKTREVADMRCQHAPANRLTEVELLFSVRGKRYKIQRQPQQQRPKARGEGLTLEKPKASLWDCSEANPKVIVANSASACTKEVQSLLGLTAEQFRQVIVLPQDNFRQFLLADSNQREAIFGQLFDTTRFKTIELKLKAKGHEIIKAVEQIKERAQGALLSADLENIEALSQAKATNEQQLSLAETWKTDAQNFLETKKNEFQQAKTLAAEFSELSKLQQTFREHQSTVENNKSEEQRLAAARLADAIAPPFENWTNAKKLNALTKTNLQQFEKQLAEVETKAETLKAQENKVKTKAEAYAKHPFEIQRLKDLRQDVERLGEVRSLLKQKQESQAQAKKQLSDHLAAQEKQSQRIQSLSDDIARTQALGPKLGKLQVVLSTLNQLAGHYQERARKKGFCAKKNQQIAAYQRELKAEKDTLASHREDVMTLEMHWHEQQAARLAKALQVDQACPVCGSTEHPHPAKPPTNQQAVLEDELNSAKEQLLRHNEQVESIHSKLQVEMAIVGESEQQLLELEKHIDVQHHNLRTQFRDSKLPLNDITSYEQTRAAIDLCQARIKSIEDKISSLADQQNNLVSLQQEQEKLTTTIKNTEKTLADLALEVSKKHEAVALLIDQLPAEINTAKALTAHLAQLEQEWQNLLGQQKRLDEAMQQNQEQRVECRTLVIAQRKQLQDAEQESQQAEAAWLQALTQTPFANQMGFAEARLSTEEQNQLQQNIDTVKQRTTRLQAAIDQQQARLANQTPPNLLDLEEQLKTCASRLQTLHDLWQEKNHRRQVLQKLEKDIATLEKKMEKLNEDYRIWGDLAQVASGQNSQKINFQRYALSVLLDEVLSLASVRLQVMSRGRYQLLRQQDKAKGNKASGLDLVVADLYTGQVRPAATLSGGESFLAALALALGLSDSVQNHAGGIKLDTLFIDEGFGSLDQEALSRAIDTLLDLQAHGRSIGIISHVEGLKELLDRRIDITSKNGESKAKLVGVEKPLSNLVN